MNLIFYNQFQVEGNKFIFFCGDESKELLSRILSMEVVGKGQKAIFLANEPLKYPVEGQILVNIEPELLKQKLQSEESKILYLCSAIEGEKLQPVATGKWAKIIKMAEPNTCFMFLISSVNKFRLPRGVAREKSFVISSFNFSNFENQLEKFLSDFKSDEKFQDELLKYWQKTTEHFCPQDFLNKNFPKLKRILFINQVKSIIDENKLMGILRNLSELYDKIFLGDINDLKIKEI